MDILVKKNGQTEMDLPAVFRLLLRKSWLIAIFALIGSAVSVFYSYRFVEPSYRTAIGLYVSNMAEGTQTAAVTTSDMAASMMLMQTCATVIKEEETMQAALELNGLDYSTEQLLEMVQVQGVENTKIMYIIVTSNNPEEAALIADSIGEIMPGMMKMIEPAGSVRVLNRARIPDKKFAPSYSKYALMGFAAGAIAAVFLLLAKAVLDTRVKTVKQLKDLGLPVLALMPEESREFKNNLIYSLPGKKGKSILFVELPQNADKPFTAEETADALAKDGSQVLIIDCNLRAPVLDKKMNLKIKQGVTDVLVGKVKSEKVVQNHKKNVDVIIAGNESLNPDSLLASEDMAEMLETLSPEYDYILILASADKKNPDAVSLAGRVSGTVIVTRRKATRFDDLKDYLYRLQSSGANVLGTVYCTEKRK